MVSESRRLRRERRTVRAMLEIYCNDHHGVRAGLCPECAWLASYADRRIDRCPFGTDKPTCANCPIHCYRTEPREKIREVMRYAGPRMLTRHPVLALLHLLVDGRRRTSELRASAGAERGASRRGRREDTAA